MSYEIVMPSLGMSQDTGTIVKWKKAVGDFINAGEEIMDIETDKAIQAIESPVSGYLSQIFFVEDVPVPVGEVVAKLETHNRTTPPADSLHSTPSELVESVKDKTPISSKKKTTPKSSISGNSLEQIKKTELPESWDKKESLLPTKVLASPKAKAYSRQLNIPLANVSEGLNKKIIHYEDLNEFQKSFQTASHGQERALSKSIYKDSVVEIEIDGNALKRLQRNFSEKNKQGISERSHRLGVRHIVAVLILKTWREFFAVSSDPISILIESFTTEFASEILTDSDLVAFKNVVPDQNLREKKPVNMRLIDLIDTPITSFNFYFTEMDTIVIYYHQDRLRIHFHETSHQDMQKKILFLNYLSEYLQEPILHLR